MVNKVILIGNLGADPEIRRLNSGDPVVSMRVATSETWRDKNTSERKEKTEWHNVVAWGKQAEIAGQYLTKGRQVYIEGRIQTRQWEGQDGQKRYTTELVANTIQNLERRPRDDAGEPGPGESFARPARPAGAPAGRSAEAPPDTEYDDLPF